MIRWKAKIIYRHGFGPVDVSHDLEELEDIQGAGRVDRRGGWKALIKYRTAKLTKAISHRKTPKIGCYLL